MSPFNSSKKLILVIGATGAQGIAVVDALLAQSADGSPSPYAVRALTRDPTHRRSQELAAKGVELFQGSFNDLENIYDALQGAYGVWVNTDSFAIGERHEVFLGARIFEVSKRVKTLRHYVWSNLDYNLKKGNYDPQYRAEHYDGKGRVAEWMKLQPSIVSDTEMSWSSVTTGPYMDMLNFIMFGPVTRRADGTYVFAAPIGSGHVPMIALSDLGYFARYTFDHRELTSGKDLEVASEMVGWDHLVATFQKVTGKKAVAVFQTIDEWMANFKDPEITVAYERTPGDGLTWRQNFSGWWAAFRDDILKRDMKWIREVNPNGHTLESWMRAVNYTGDRPSTLLLKDAEDYNRVRPNLEHIAATLG